MLLLLQEFKTGRLTTTSSNAAPPLISLGSDRAVAAAARRARLITVLVEWFGAHFGGCYGEERSACHCPRGRRRRGQRRENLHDRSPSHQIQLAASPSNGHARTDDDAIGAAARTLALGPRRRRGHRPLRQHPAAPGAPQCPAHRATGSRRCTLAPRAVAGRPPATEGLRMPSPSDVAASARAAGPARAAAAQLQCPQAQRRIRPGRLPAGSPPSHALSPMINHLLVAFGRLDDVIKAPGSPAWPESWSHRGRPRDPPWH